MNKTLQTVSHPNTIATSLLSTACLVMFYFLLLIWDVAKVCLHGTCRPQSEPVHNDGNIMKASVVFNKFKIAHSLG